MQRDARHRCSQLGLARLVTALLVLIAWGVLTSPATAGVNKNLCRYDPLRGEVPSDYVLDGCVDGRYIVIKNDEDFPVVLLPSRQSDGRTKGPLRFDHKSISSYALIARTAHKRTPATVHGTVVLPGDRVRFEVGDNGAHIATIVNNRDYYIYLGAELVASVVPGIRQVDSFNVFVNVLNASFNEYTACKSRGILAASKCYVRFVGRDIAALTRFLIELLPAGKPALKIARSLLLDTATGRSLLTNPQRALRNKNPLVVQDPLYKPCGPHAPVTFRFWESYKPPSYVDALGPWVAGSGSPNYTRVGFATTDLDAALAGTTHAHWVVTSPPWMKVVEQGNQSIIGGAAPYLALTGLFVADPPRAPVPSGMTSVTNTFLVSVSVELLAVRDSRVCAVGSRSVAVSVVSRSKNWPGPET